MRHHVADLIVLEDLEDRGPRHVFRADVIRPRRLDVTIAPALRALLRVRRGLDPERMGIGPGARFRVVLEQVTWPEPDDGDSYDDEAPEPEEDDGDDLPF